MVDQLVDEGCGRQLADAVVERQRDDAVDALRQQQLGALLGSREVVALAGLVENFVGVGEKRDGDGPLPGGARAFRQILDQTLMPQMYAVEDADSHKRICFKIGLVKIAQMSHGRRRRLLPSFYPDCIKIAGGILYAVSRRLHALRERRQAADPRRRRKPSPPARRRIAQ